MSFFRKNVSSNPSNAGSILPNSMKNGDEKELLGELASLEKEATSKGKDIENQDVVEKDKEVNFGEEMKGSGFDDSDIGQLKSGEFNLLPRSNSIGSPLNDRPIDAHYDSEREIEEREFAIENLRYRGLIMLRICFALSLSLIIAASTVGSIWIYTGSKGQFVNGKLQDVYGENDWQSCINANVISYKGVNQVQPNNFAVDAAAFAGQSLIFLGLSFKACYMALMDLYLLPYTMTVGVITLIGMTLYRPVNPIIPMVNTLSPTLFSFIHYINNDMYNDVKIITNNFSKTAASVSPDVCKPAISLNNVFLICQYITVAVNLIVISIQLYAAYTWAKQRMPRHEVPYIMSGYHGCLVLSAISFSAYICTVILKEIASWTTQDVYVEAKWEGIFPYQRPTLDVVGLFMLITVTTCISGWCRQDTELFKNGAFTAFIYLCLAYPLIVNNFEAFKNYGFWSGETCKDILLIPGTSITQTLKADNVGNWEYLFDSATPGQIKTICTCFRGSLVAQFIQFVCMHLMILASLFVVRENLPSKNPTLQEMRSLQSMVASELTGQNEPLLSQGLDRFPTIDASLSSVGKEYRLTRASRGHSLSHYNGQYIRNPGQAHQSSVLLDSPALFDPSLE